MTKPSNSSPSALKAITLNIKNNETDSKGGNSKRAESSGLKKRPGSKSAKKSKESSSNGVADDSKPTSKKSGNSKSFSKKEASTKKHQSSRKSSSKQMPKKNSKSSPKLAPQIQVEAKSATVEKVRAISSIEAQKEEKSAALYVGDLDPRVTESLLLTIFSTVSPVASLRVCNNPDKGKQLSYAYINFKNEDDAQIATEKLNYSKIMDSEIRIMPSFRDKTQNMNKLGTNVFFSNLPNSLSTRQFYETFRPFGEILSCKLNHDKHQGFILFKDRAEAAKVVDKFNDTMLLGSRLYVGAHTAKKDRDKQKTLTLAVGEEEKTIVFVKNLPYQVSEADLESRFSRFGSIISIFIKPVSRIEACWALVTFESKQAAQSAIRNLTNTRIGNNVIDCSLADHQSKTSQTSSTVVFKKLPKSVSHKEIFDKCSAIGKVVKMVTSVEIEEDVTQDTVLIRFESEETAKKAVEMFMNYKMDDGSVIHSEMFKLDIKLGDSHIPKTAHSSISSRDVSSSLNSTLQENIRPSYLSDLPISVPKRFDFPFNTFTNDGQMMVPVAHGDPLGLMASNPSLNNNQDDDEALVKLEDIVNTLLINSGHGNENVENFASTISKHVFENFWSGDSQKLMTFMLDHSRDNKMYFLVRSQASQAVETLSTSGEWPSQL